MADPVEEAAERLYALPLEDFIRERDAQAKALRKAGEKDAAATVAKLPKPSQVAWVANRLGREDVAGELLAAGDALREAQLGGGGREALREATAAERKAVETLIRAAGGHRELSRDATDRLRSLLHALAGDDDLRERFTAGRIVEEPEAGGAWPSGAFVTPPAGERKAKRKEAPAARGSGETAAARRKREERERKAADRAKREAERKREETERRRLERRLHAARQAADEAKVRLDAAREAYEDATHEVARIEEQLS